jgi:hypothetical protein
MYPKRFTFDPRLIERARVVTLRSPDLNVLRDENRAELPGLAHFLEQGFKARHAEGKLLLPDLSALANRTVGIFSDYGGEDSTSRFFTYSFLVCAFGSLDPFKQQMATLRAKSGIGGKEIAFKDFRWGPLRRITLSLGQNVSHVTSAATYPVHYDPLIDFEPVALLATTPYLLLAKNAMPADDLKG